MDYQLRRNRTELDSTGYMEIGPGRYSGEHWQEGFIFIGEDAFGVAEGIIERHFPSYDHMGMNDLPNAIVVKVIRDWRNAAEILQSLNRIEIETVLNLTDSQYADLRAEVETNRKEVSDLLRALANECEDFLRQNDWLCILGM
ncbi:MAG: hypothetical protein ACR2FY_05810 [Pirellulaceae bacterium]